MDSYYSFPHRTSAAEAYSNAGALMSSIGSKVANNSNNSDHSNNAKTEEYATNSIENSSHSASTLPKDQLHQLHQSYSYGRSVPLPIPTKRESPSTVNENPVLSATNPKTVQNHQGRLNVPLLPNQMTLSTIVASPLAKAPTFQPKQPISATKKGQTIIPVPAPTPSMLEATKKRSQFGFGGNHFVSSVPLPPTHQKKNNSSTTSKSKTTSSSRKRATNSASQTKSIATKTTTVTECVSYERKKQRAKDARVKLNESIERLSVAIGLAGTQSRQRSQAHAYWENKESTSTLVKDSPINVQSSNVSTGTTAVVQNGIKSTVEIMEEAGQTADAAKKWERPSFVGSAATMIQNLNAQCEALMRELIEMKKLQNDGNLQQCQCGRKVRASGTGTVSDISSHEEMDSSNNTLNDFDFDTRHPEKKRMKFSNEEMKVDMNSIVKRDRVLLLIGSYLDPRSIVRFKCVSKAWKVQLEPAMKNNSIWSSLCVQRFGTYNFREWLHRHEDEALILNEPPISHLTLYREMNSSNVRPRCRYEGNVHLGGGQIGNIACGWISAVERSNGETLRSVLSSTCGDIKYSSLPIIELRILVQNVGVADGSILIPEQIISVDASTKRRGEEFFEINSDHRMKKKIYSVNGEEMVNFQNGSKFSTAHSIGSLINLDLFDTAVISVFIHAKGCPTTAKFIQKANFGKVLINVRGTTLPLVIPIAQKNKRK